MNYQGSYFMYNNVVEQNFDRIVHILSYIQLLATVAATAVHCGPHRSIW